LFRSTAPEDPSAGFTLIEALVALSIVTVALASIGSLIASTARGVRSTNEHLTRLETARAVITALPDRNQLAVGALSGTIADHSWRVDVLPFAQRSPDQKSLEQWVPQKVVVTVESPNGAAMQISTIRLKRRGAR
jgi:general secretion pathway protein I